MYVICAGLRREIERVAQDYDYDWKGQLENLESDNMVTLRMSNAGQNPGKPGLSASSSRPSQSEETSSSQRSGTTPRSQVSNSDRKRTSEGTSSIQGIDIDATIDEAVELEQQTRLKAKQRNRGKGSKGEVSIEGKGE